VIFSGFSIAPFKMKPFPHPILVAGSISFCSLVTGTPSTAQISSDNTLPTTVNQSGNGFEITGGLPVGNNLFHSFREFSVPTGNQAFFNNSTNLNNIVNIITRVTGGSASTIDGLIRENYGANLVLINPSGITFGPNAQLNIGGSFLASTANSLKFADGTEFSATDAQAPRLTISVPLGLQFGQNPGAIRVQGTGHNLTVANPIFSPVTRGSSTGLAVQPGQTLALVGGDVRLEGATLTAEGGRIELGSVSGGLVGVNPASRGWTFGYDGVSTFRDIELRSQSLVDVSGVNGGSIQAQGQNLSIRDGSLFLIQNQGNQAAGSIRVNSSNSVTISGTNEDGTIRSSLTNETVGLGPGGNVEVSTRQLAVDGGGTIVAKTFSPATGGNVNVNAADSLRVVGTSSANPSVTTSIVAATFGPGNSGNNTVSTRRLSAIGGGTIATASFGTGIGGDLTINATNSTDVLGVEPLLFAPSALATSAFNAGNAGNLTLTTPRVSIRDGGRIGSVTSASGKAGDVIINAPEFVEVKGNVPGSVNPSLISSSANLLDPVLQQLFGVPAVPSGASGDVVINTGQFVIADQAQVTTRNDGSGLSGSMRITANSISLDNGGSIAAEMGGRLSGGGQPSIFSPITLGGSKGGAITLSTQRLAIRSGANVSTNSFTNAAGGDININASESLDVIGSSPINPTALSFISSAANGSGNSGNVMVSTGRLSILGGARVGAGTFSSGAAGNVTVGATKFVEVVGAEPRLLTSSLLGVSTLNNGNAGNLTVNTPSLFVLDGGRVDSSTAAAGTAGNVTINAFNSVEVSGTIPGTRVPSQISSGANIENEITRQILRLPPVPSGASGDVTVNTGRLRINNSAQISSKNEGLGSAGNARVNARSISLDRGGAITASTQSGEGGNVFLRTNALQLRRGSQISAEAGGTANGGNISLTGLRSQNYVALLEGSRITANALRGRGGNIQIDTQGLFICPECQITASSAFGVSGSVDIITPDGGNNQESADVPQEVGNSEEVVVQACQAKKRQNRSEFTITGRGGLPPRPSDPQSSSALVGFEPAASPDRSSLPAAATEKDIAQLPVPAQGWYVNDRGVVVLAAMVPTATPYSPGLRSAECHEN
jgi:filamentous hemagglutinin family protein